MTNYAALSDRAFIASMVAVVVQIILIVLSTMVVVPEHKSPNITICVLLLLPLLIILPWLLWRNIRAHIWLCFLMLGYFMPSVQSAFLWQQYGFLPFVEIANEVYAFIVAMMFARWEQKRYQISVTR